MVLLVVVDMVVDMVIVALRPNLVVALVALDSYVVSPVGFGFG
jgi:hypothetical protein